MRFHVLAMSEMYCKTILNWTGVCEIVQTTPSFQFVWGNREALLEGKLFFDDFQEHGSVSGRGKL